MSNTSRKYFYVVDVLDLQTGFGSPIAPLKEHALAFVATPTHARGILFANGYNLDSEKGLFTDNGERFVSEMFDTTDGSNGTEDDVPDRLSVLLKSHPLLRVYPGARFGKLHIYRTPMTHQNAGRKSRRSKRSRRQRRTRRH